MQKPDANRQPRRSKAKRKKQQRQGINPAFVMESGGALLNVSPGF
ncbi:hypothetical protein BN128_2081 [Cronobacter sakazakii 696]|nr:hypothetical protein BN128_2081 [Cronobacter sakazakii 696]